MKRLTKIIISFAVLAIVALTAFAYGDVDVSANQNTLTVEVFPNPVTGEEFTLTSNAEITEVSIVNILGQKVYDEHFTGETKINIELEISEKGIYLIQVKTFDGRVATKRILFK